MGKVGADAFGEMAGLLLDKEWGVRDSLVVDESAETSYTVVINPKGYDRMFVHNAGANNTFCAKDIDYEKVAERDLFHFGYPPLMKQIIAHDGADLIEIFRRVKALGLTTSLDMCLPDGYGRVADVNYRNIIACCIYHP